MTKNEIAQFWQKVISDDIKEVIDGSLKWAKFSKNNPAKLLTPTQVKLLVFDYHEDYKKDLCYAITYYGVRECCVNMRTLN